ncbi:MAG TPA: efflux RND transporter periplasmic adaptor subunit [Pirellulales bacterium]|jgi:macrolide-specific efflux system membrane fusion protein|nr:efflux RND transporter periplasmic adaptor subunit [Pirellulales bacterium]
MKRTIAVFVLLVLFVRASGAEQNGGAIHVDSVVVTLIEQVEVSSREAGPLANVAVQEGQSVTEGTLLARLEDTEAVLARNKAQFEFEIAKKQADSDVKLRYAKKSLEVATTEEQRGLESVGKFSKSVSQSELDQLRLAKEKAALEYEQAQEDQEVAALTAKQKQNEVDTATFNIERRRVVAPISGVVVQIKRRRGEWVQPGDSIVRILRMDRLRAEAFLSSRETGGDLVGRPVSLVVDLPGAPRTEFHGKVAFVSPEVNPVNGQFRVWAEIENRDQLLRPGLQGSMTILPRDQ